MVCSTTMGSTVNLELWHVLNVHICLSLEVLHVEDIEQIFPER